jgi:hypothetical protein
MLRKDEDGLIRYNYPKLAAISKEIEQVYNELENY